MGQHLIVQGDYPEMMYLRGGTEARDFQAAWRNAELMERTGSPVESFSAAYHDARDGNPNNPHLFFCVERSLCRAGNWTDLISLYEAGNARNSELAAIFERANFDVHPYRTATQVFLAPTKRQEFMVDLEEWIGRADGEFDGAFWQLIGHEFATDPGRALGRLEILKQHDQDAPPSRALRTNLWYAQLVGKKLGQTKKLGEIFAAMLNDASSPLAKRYAARGLVAEQRYEELAAFTASNPKNARWLVDADSEMTHHALAAELYALAGDFKKALEYLWSVASKATNDRELAEASERAIALSLRNNHWKGVLPFLPTIFGTEHHRTIAGLVRHIAAALDDAEESLERIDTAKIESKDDPNTLLSEIELAYRARDFSRLVALLQRSLRTLAAGSIDFRSFILEQGVLVSEWSDPKASGAFLDDLLALQKNARSTPVFTLAAQFRHAARTSKRKKTSIKALTKKAKELFTPAIVETLAEEARVVEEATTGEEAAAWYAARAPDVPEQIRPYYRFMASFLMWTFGDRSRTNVQEFADAVSLGDPSHQIGDFLLAIAYRDAGLQDLAERQLKSIFSAHCEPVRDWAAVRQFFHLAVTGGETELALNELNESDEFRSYPWYETLRELFQRALRREDAIDALRRRAKVAPGRRMVALEIAELENDLDALKKLEAVGLISAKFRVFIRAVQDNVYTADDVEGLYADVADAMTTGAEDADDLFSNYVSTVDRTFIGTPWCPIALWERHAGKSDVQLVKDHVRQLEATLTRVDDEMANEARLFVAKRYAEIGVSDASTRLAPRNHR